MLIVSTYSFDKLIERRQCRTASRLGESESQMMVVERLVNSVAKVTGRGVSWFNPNFSA